MYIYVYNIYFFNAHNILEEISSEDSVNSVTVDHWKWTLFSWFGRVLKFRTHSHFIAWFLKKKSG